MSSKKLPKRERTIAACTAYAKTVDDVRDSEYVLRGGHGELFGRGIYVSSISQLEGCFLDGHGHVAGIDGGSVTFLAGPSSASHFARNCIYCSRKVSVGEVKFQAKLYGMSTEPLESKRPNSFPFKERVG